jgi:hypothetical protein
MIDTTRFIKLATGKLLPETRIDEVFIEGFKGGQLGESALTVLARLTEDRDFESEETMALLFGHHMGHEILIGKLFNKSDTTN